MNNNNDDETSLDSYIQELYRNPVNSPDYNLAKGEIHDRIAFEYRCGMEAEQISRALHRGDVSIAENIVDEILEGE